MQRITEFTSGIYILEIHATECFTVNNPRFENFHLPEGWYYYVGSAQKYLQSRIARHIKKDKIIHWHIDYITSQKNNNITSVVIIGEKTKDFECRLNFILSQNFLLKYMLRGFGNSDCNSCISHLAFSKKRLFIDPEYGLQRVLLNNGINLNNIDFILYK